MFYNNEKTVNGDWFKAVDITENVKTNLNENPSYSKTPLISEFNVKKDFEGLKHLPDSILIIGSSTDHVLEAVYKGIKNIELVDVNRFTRYLLALKIALLKTCSKDDYVKFLENSVTTKEIRTAAFRMLPDNERDFFVKLTKESTFDEIKKNLLQQINLFNIKNFEYLKEDNYINTVLRLSISTIKIHDYNMVYNQTNLFKTFDTVFIMDDVDINSKFKNLDEFLNEVTTRDSKKIQSIKLNENTNIDELDSCIIEKEEYTKNENLNLFKKEKSKLPNTNSKILDYLNTSDEYEKCYKKFDMLLKQSKK